MPSANFLLRRCTFKICSRPWTSGRPTVARRSKRPGRSRAWSKMSERLVAATTMTPLLPSKPSISVKILELGCQTKNKYEMGPEFCQKAPGSESSIHLKRFILVRTCCLLDFFGGFQSNGFFTGFAKGLIEGLFPFIVSTPHARAPLSADCIDLIDEDNAGRLFLQRKSFRQKAVEPQNGLRHGLSYLFCAQNVSKCSQV